MIRFSHVYRPYGSYTAFGIPLSSIKYPVRFRLASECNPTGYRMHEHAPITIICRQNKVTTTGNISFINVQNTALHPVLHKYAFRKRTVLQELCLQKKRSSGGLCDNTKRHLLKANKRISVSKVPHAGAYM